MVPVWVALFRLGDRNVPLINNNATPIKQNEKVLLCLLFL